MKISVLAYDLSGNCLGRAYLLAKILQRHYQVEIVGPILGTGIWAPLAKDKSIEYKSVKLSGCVKPYWQLKELVKMIEGKVIYASKPLSTSYGIGLLKKLLSNRPLVLDIDDWEMGFIKEYYKSLPFYRQIGSLAFSAFCLYKRSSLVSGLIAEKCIRFADEITVSDSFLRDKFGGRIIWHARDTNTFDPAKFDKYRAREKYKIEEGKKLVMFFGTPQPYKGIEDLVKAVSLIKGSERSEIILAVVGIDNNKKYNKELAGAAKEALHDRFIGFGIQDFEDIPEILSMADLVIVPQRKSLATIGQMPAKVFDAMAMAKPIIATDVSDLPEVLDGCGWIVESNDPQHLSETIKYVFNNFGEAERRGRQARQKCIEKYSWDSMEKSLTEVFEKYE